MNKFRLNSNVYERENDEDKVEPLKIYFLSVEGNVKEKEYFKGVSRYRERLKINSRVDVEVLERSSKDTNSAPKQVIELLEEYLRLRERGEQELIEEIPDEFIETYGIEFIQKFLNNPSSIPKKSKNQFLTELKMIGYDIKYRKYLTKYRGKWDEFGVLIDRDIYTHSETNMEECIEHCKQKGYNCYIANPCFEFWLLLHLSDVKTEYSNKLDLIKANEKVSDKHTFVSKEISEKAGHGKGGIHFEQNYLDNIQHAIEHAKDFANTEEELMHEIGCNLGKLFVEMQEFEEEKS